MASLTSSSSSSSSSCSHSSCSSTSSLPMLTSSDASLSFLGPLQRRRRRSRRSFLALTSLVVGCSLFAAQSFVGGRSQAERLQAAWHSDVPSLPLASSTFVLGAATAVSNRLANIGRERVSAKSPPHAASYLFSSSSRQQQMRQSPVSHSTPAAAGTGLPRRASSREATSSWSSDAFGERLTRPQWLRLYRTLGLDEGATGAEINRAAGRLRRKYAKDEEALERVEQAQLWLMTKLLNEPQEPEAYASEPSGSMGSAWGLGGLVEAPQAAELGSTSFLMILFALLGCIAPNQATTFIGFAAMTCLSMIYQRHRPSPVQDQFGRDGKVQKVNYKEAALAAAMTIAALVFGFGLAIAVTRLLLRRSSAFAPSPALISCCACGALWLAATCGKVYGYFET